MPTHSLVLDVMKTAPSIPQQVVIRQGEAGTQTIAADIVNGGKAYTPSLPSVRLDVMHADGTWSRCSATKSGSKATCTLPNQAASKAGRCRLAHFVFFDANGKAESTEGFEMLVLPCVDVSNADAEAEFYDDMLTELWKKWDAYEKQAEANEKNRIREHEELKAESEGATARAYQAAAEVLRRAEEGYFDGPQGPQGPKGDTGSGLELKGAKPSVSELPAEGNAEGDAYMVGGSLYVWDGSEWEGQGPVKGPKGDKGDKGDAGDPIEQGAVIPVANGGTGATNAAAARKALGAAAAEHVHGPEVIADGSVTAAKLDPTAIAAIFGGMRIRYFRSDDPATDQGGMSCPSGTSLWGYYVEDIQMLVLTKFQKAVGTTAVQSIRDGDGNCWLPSYVPRPVSTLTLSGFGVMTWANDNYYKSWSGVGITPNGSIGPYTAVNADGMEIVGNMVAFMGCHSGGISADDFASYARQNGTVGA